jgi:aminopeptidase-like protein
LKEEEYEVCIDSFLEEGHLTYGEYYLKGKSPDEILISCHACHPSLCNDNLSGVALATFLAKYLSDASSRYSYRFLFIPGTIGSVVWLSLNESNISRIKHGLVLACVGDGGKFTYKRSRRGNSEIDQAVLHVLKNYCKSYEVNDFFPYGYDERQYCSPGFNLPVGCLMRTPHGRFPEYHTSADDLSFIKPEYLGESFEKYSMVLGVLENNAKYINQNQKCEPQLGKRGLYPSMQNREESMMNQLAMLWVLNFSDGEYTLLDIADRSDLPFDVIKNAAAALLRTGLLNDSVEKENRRAEVGDNR